ncbi:MULTISPECIES: methyl-accepting chemotaxis protein [unclassified Marinitoga]|uniref:methyl-accepting chemotaxis protein n=1 Tax=unclassified Marinitoga TaxID=2640159 RepID=UPI00158658EA|nr:MULTISPECIES: methyl-accepting chemotaxis protein [unclassified Marinitoga]
MKMFHRYLLYFLIIGLLPILALFLVVLNGNKKVMHFNSQSRYELIESSVSRFFQNEFEQLSDIAKKYALDIELKEALKNEDREKAKEILVTAFETLKPIGIKVLEVEDKNGVVFYRGHHPGKFGDNKSEVVGVKLALQGKANYGFDFGKSGFGLRTFVPIMDNGNVIGVVQTGIPFSKESLDLFKKMLTTDMAVYTKDGLYATTSDEFTLNKDKILPIFNEIGDKKYELIHSDKKGISYLVLPLREPNGNLIGVLSVLVDTRKIDTLNSKIRGTIILTIFITFILVIIFAYIITKALLKRINHLIEGLERMSEGDLTVELIDHGKDEMSHVFKRLEQMMDNFKSMLKTVIETGYELDSSSGKLIEVAQKTEKNAVFFHDESAEIEKNTNDVASAMEEITSGVEEIASSAQMVSENAQELSAIASETIQNAEEGTKSLKEIAEIIEEAVNQSKVTENKVEELLKLAENIGEIVETINTITEQTNLLALNAAIEAARAGEAGKGFAVVADEIRKLAEESKKATEEIAQILSHVQNGVKDVNGATLKTVDIINQIESGTQKVNENFDVILEKIEIINQRVESLTASSEEQSASTEEMAAAMDKSMKTILEISNKISEITRFSLEQKDDAKVLNSVSQELKQHSEALKENIKKFKI